jgi:hypothetical protein
MNSHPAFAVARRPFAGDTEFQERQESASSSPHEKHSKSVFVEFPRGMRFKFLTAPKSTHSSNLIAEGRRSWFSRRSCPPWRGTKGPPPLTSTEAKPGTPSSLKTWPCVFVEFPTRTRLQFLYNTKFDPAVQPIRKIFLNFLVNYVIMHP